MSPLSMREYVDITGKQGTPWKEPVVVGPYKGPSLPAMKTAARKVGALDFTAGDIADTGKGLNPEFLAWRDEVRREKIQAGYGPFAESEGDAHGFPSNYQPDHPPLILAKLRSYGMIGPEEDPEGSQTTCNNVSSGRLAINGLFSALQRWARKVDASKKPVGILDPLAWGGLRDSLEENDLGGVYAPVTEGGGFGLTEEGLRESHRFIADRGEMPLFAYTIDPSNPSGEKSTRENMLAVAKACHELGMTLIIDVFYAPISPEGIHAEDSLLRYLRANLTPEEWANIVVIEGDTKVVGFPRTASVMMSTASPKTAFLAQMFQRNKATLSTYPDPRSALTSLALHTFSGGIHKAMGERYRELEASREIFRTEVARVVPIVGDSTFYSAVALVDNQGASLVLGPNGQPAQTAEQVGTALLRDHHLAIAPMALFRDGVPGSLVRATAATTRANARRFVEILEALKGNR